MIERMDGGSAESLLTFAEQAGPGLRGLDGRAVVARFEERYGELVAAVEWFVALAKAMGSADFERARAAGRSMTSREAVDYALGAPTRNGRPRRIRQADAL
jgi:hypothetical protein